jgi:hypothetical protein
MIYDLLYGWQKRIADLAAGRNAYGLFLDCGLGKTPIGLASAERSGCVRIIVVTVGPKAEESASVPGSWKCWAGKYGSGVRVLGKKAGIAECSDPSPAILIVNYEYLCAHPQPMHGFELRDTISAFVRASAGKPFCLIADESHRMKNPGSLQSKGMDQIYKTAKLICPAAKAYLMTGTPFTTGYIDLYAQLRFLGCPINKTQFEDRFCEMGRIPGLMAWQQPIVGYRNLDQLYALVHKYAITMQSSDVVDLPEKIFVRHTSGAGAEFDLLTEQRIKGSEIIAEDRRRQSLGFMPVPKARIDEAKADPDKRLPNPWYKDMSYPGEQWFADTAGSLWLRARQLSIGFQGNEESSYWFSRSRLDQLKDFLAENPDNYVLFYNYVPEFIELYLICESLGYGIDAWNGEIKSMPNYGRYSAEPPEKQVTDRKNVILANFASGSTGMNWQAYSKCVLFSLPLYKDWEQSLKRIHRIGQRQTAIYHVFSADNWLDKSMQLALDDGIQYTEDLFEKDLERNAKP